MNDREGLAKTIASVKAQDYPVFEYIVIDGASIDGTLEVIKSYASDIDIYISEPDRGLYDAMNKGKSLATGSWALFLNAGDEFATTRALHTILTPLPAGDALVCGNILLSYRLRTWRIPRRIAGHPSNSYIPHHQTILYPTSFYKDNDYDLNFSIVADADYTQRALALCTYEDRNVDLTVSTLGGYTFTMYQSFGGALRMHSERQKLYRKYSKKFSRVHSIFLSLSILAKFLSVKIGGVSMATTLMQLKAGGGRSL